MLKFNTHPLWLTARSLELTKDISSATSASKFYKPRHFDIMNIENLSTKKILRVKSGQIPPK